jgi:hypothetical protein
MNDPVFKRLFSLLQSVVQSAFPDVDLFIGMNGDEWKALYRLAAQEGVLATVFDSMMQLPENLHPPHELKVSWTMSVDYIEQQYERKLSVAQELATRFGEHNIRMLIVKGLSIAQYYPVPSRREFGDLDIYLSEKYEEGNRLLEQWGAFHDSIDYKKHTGYIFKGIPVENHSYFLVLLENAELLSRDDTLFKTMADEELKNATTGKIVFPASDFTLLFFMYHALVHFVTERLRWRYFCDWAILLLANQGKWNQTHYDAMFPLGSGIRKIADVITSITIDYLGLPSEVAPPFNCDKKLKKRILKEMTSPISYNNSEMSRWRIMIYKIQQFISLCWRMELVVPGAVKRKIWLSFLYHLRHPSDLWILNEK